MSQGKTTKVVYNVHPDVATLRRREAAMVHLLLNAPSEMTLEEFLQIEGVVMLVERVRARAVDDLKGMHGSEPINPSWTLYSDTAELRPS